MAVRSIYSDKDSSLAATEKASSDNLIGSEDGFVKNLTMGYLEYLLK